MTSKSVSNEPVTVRLDNTAVLVISVIRVSLHVSETPENKEDDYSYNTMNTILLKSSKSIN